MPLYKFDITLKSGRVISGCRLIESSDLETIFREARAKCRKKYQSVLAKFDCIMVSSLSETYRTWWLAYRKTNPWQSNKPKWMIDDDPLEPEDPGDPSESKRDQHSRETREKPGWGELKRKEREKKQ